MMRTEIQKDDLTAAQAYEKWKAAPDKVKIIDVGTPEEFAFVDHQEMVWNIPLTVVSLIALLATVGVYGVVAYSAHG